MYSSAPALTIRWQTDIRFDSPALKELFTTWEVIPFFLFPPIPLSPLSGLSPYSLASLPVPSSSLLVVAAAPLYPSKLSLNFVSPLNRRNRETRRVLFLTSCPPYAVDRCRSFIEIRERCGTARTARKATLRQLPQCGLIAGAPFARCQVGTFCFAQFHRRTRGGFSTPALVFWKFRPTLFHTVGNLPYNLWITLFDIRECCVSNNGKANIYLFMKR